MTIFLDKIYGKCRAILEVNSPFNRITLRAEKALRVTLGSSSMLIRSFLAHAEKVRKIMKISIFWSTKQMTCMRAVNRQPMFTARGTRSLLLPALRTMLDYPRIALEPKLFNDNHSTAEQPKT